MVVEMAKYRKKPVIIEAEQWSPGKNINGVISVIIRQDGLILGEYSPDTDIPSDCNLGFGIKTLEGWHQVVAKDWIITGVKGERYPCKPDIFEMTYEPVVELEATG